MRSKELTDIISEDDYYKGLYYREPIDFDEVVKHENKKLFKFRVESQRTYHKYYVSVTKEDNKIVETFCECAQFERFGSCKHLAAVLLQKKDILNKETMADNPIKISNKILEMFDKQQKKAKIKKLANIEIEIEQYEDYYGFYYTIKFKIGEKRMYVLNKKITSFIDAYQYSEYSTYFGKEFEYNNEDYYFSKEDESIIDFMISNRQINWNYTFQEKDFIRLLKEIPDKQITITTKKLGTNKYKGIHTGNPFKTKLIKEGNNYKLIFTNLDKLSLYNEELILSSNKIYKLNNETKKIVYALKEYETDNITISKKNLDNFTNGLLNIVKSDIFVDKELENEIVICSTPSVKLYIDYHYNKIECKPIFIYNNNEIEYFDTSANVLRDTEYENKVINDIYKYNFKLENKKFIINEIDSIGNFIENDIISLANNYEVYTSDKVKKTKIQKTTFTSTFSIGKDNILKYEFNLGSINKEEADDLLLNLKNKKKYYKLKSGYLINLDEDDNLKQLNDLLDDMQVNNLENGTLPKYRAIYLSSIQKDKYNIIETNNLFDDFIEKFNKYKDIELTLSKKDLSTLRDYQLTGVKWLYNIYKCELGSVLADEMGLGKSIQLIYLIKQIIKEQKDAKILIVAPTSLIFNWEKEFDKFGKELKYKVIYGAKQKRTESLKENDANILITTYGLLREDIDIYKEMNFEIMAIDEAQKIKNISTMISKAVKKVPAKVKLALTGTPLENTVLELWNIFDFIMPGYLANIKTFQSKYNIKDMNEENVNKLNSLNEQIKPFILRRKKDDVLKELPPKIENNIYIELNEEQKKLYAANVKKTKEEMEEIIATEGYTKARFKILQLLTKLRQLCIDPKLVYSNYDKESSKITQLVDLTKDIIKNDHKILLFTSFKTALDIVEKEFNKNNITTYRIDGSVSSKKRMELVDKFNEDNTNVFLITIASGGTGLNLTSADVVIHLDLWWNPQVENQATDRAHRIGQKNTVEVIKLICKGTIEERILELQNKKKLLAQTLIEGEDRDKNIISNLSEEDIKSLFQYSEE